MSERMIVLKECKECPFNFYNGSDYPDIAEDGHVIDNSCGLFEKEVKETPYEGFPDWCPLDLAPKKYKVDYGDGDFEYFYAKDETDKYLLAFGLATEHYWFETREQIGMWMEEESIKVEECEWEE